MDCENRTIPRRIIQTGKTRSLPLRARAAQASMQCLNPDFEYVYFDDAEVHEFIRREFPAHVDVYERFPYRIQRFDFFRYLVVYRLGGFYFDLDVYLATGLEPLLTSSCVFPFEELTLSRYLRSHCGMDWEIGNYAFGAAAGHPFLKAVIENCVRAQKEPGWVAPMFDGIPRLFRSEFHVLNTTGPGLITRTLVEQPDLSDRVDVLFPKDVCDPDDWHQFGDYGTHLMEGSWRERGGYLWRRLACRWEKRCRERLLVESRSKGRTRKLPLQTATA